MKYPTATREAYLRLRASGLTQERAMEQCGIRSRSTVWQWEKTSKPEAARAEVMRPLERTSPGPPTPKTATVRANARRKRRERIGPERDDLGLPEGVIEDVLDVEIFQRMDETADTVPVTIGDSAQGVIQMHVHPAQDVGTDLPAYVERQRTRDERDAKPLPYGDNEGQRHPMLNPQATSVGHGALEGEGLPRQPESRQSPLERKRQLARRVSIPLR